MITQNDIDILNFIHNRLVEKYKENPNVDYLIKAREVIGYLQQGLLSGVIANHEQALPNNVLAVRCFLMNKAMR
jgi:hypothetical protein